MSLASSRAGSGLRAALLFMLALLFAECAAAATVAVRGDAQRIDLSDAFDYRADSSGLLGVAAVAADVQEFRAIDRRNLNRGFSRDAHWLRITLVNSADAPLTRWLEIGHARLQSVRLYWREGGEWRELATGTLVPRDNKPVVAAVPVLPFTLAPREQRTVFVRVASETAVTLEGTLWEPLAFRGEEGAYFLGRGAYLAAQMLAAVFALLTYILMRDRIYLFFALGLMFQLGFEACMAGVVQRYLWPAALPFSSGFITFCSGLAVFFHSLFLRAFLDLRRNLPFWDYVYIALAGLALLGALGAQFHNFGLWARVITPLVLILVVLAPSLCLVLVRRGNRPARFLMTGLATMWLALFQKQAMTLGLMPAWSYGEIAVPLATVLASTLILLAITERTRELRDALTDANAVNAAKTMFIAHMSHELRSPLGTVIGFARLLRRGAAYVAPREAGRAIERSGLHLLSIIDDLLDLARGELGRSCLDPAPTAWTEFIDTIAEAARAMTHTTGNRFVLDVGGTFPAAVMIDARRLRQVLENLLANANRHTHGGVVKLACHAEPVAESANVRLRFHVIDTGEGIATGDVERIFEPFQRGERHSVQHGAQGAGLGLFIARQLTAQMGGELRLEETSPQGTTFGFAIECAAFANAETTLPVDTQWWPEYRDRKETVLVVEDMAEARDFLAGMLRAVGFKVIAAASGQEALKRVDASVDLVLTDQFMPDGDGWDVLRWLRQREFSAPVILVSAAAPLRPVDFPEHLDFDAMIDKPLDPAQLFGVMGELLGIAWETKQAVELPLPASGDAIAMPPAERRAELAGLLAEGRVTDIEEWACILQEGSPEWQDYAIRVRDAVLRLDFATLKRLASC